MNDKVSELKMSDGRAHYTSTAWGNLDLENCSGITQLNWHPGLSLLHHQQDLRYIIIYMITLHHTSMINLISEIARIYSKLTLTIKDNISLVWFQLKYLHWWQQAAAGQDPESGIARLCRSCHGKLLAGPALAPVLLEAIMQCWSWIKSAKFLDILSW